MEPQHKLLRRQWLQPGSIQILAYALNHFPQYRAELSTIDQRTHLHPLASGSLPDVNQEFTDLLQTARRQRSLAAFSEAGAKLAEEHQRTRTGRTADAQAGLCGIKIRLSNSVPASFVMRRAGDELSSMLTADFEQKFGRETDQP